MTIIAGKPFTQLLNLNIIDELRVKGQLVTGFVIVEISADYDVDIDDEVVIAVGGLTKNVNLPLASTASHTVSIKNRVASTATVLITGGDLIDGDSSVSLGLNESVTLAPFSGGWVRL